METERKPSQIFLERILFYEKLMGVESSKIRIRTYKSKWGSCTRHGVLSFNVHLIFAPPEILDYVVVHELAHLTHQNHSRNFWAHVERYFPNHRECRRWLRTQGPELLRQTAPVV